MNIYDFCNVAGILAIVVIIRSIFDASWRRIAIFGGATVCGLSSFGVRPLVDLYANHVDAMSFRGAGQDVLIAVAFVVLLFLAFATIAGILLALGAPLKMLRLSRS